MQQLDVIRWKLNEVMARNRVRNKDLAEALDITENSVYRLRKVDEMPRLAPERLNGICAALKCQPGDLLEWVPDEVEVATPEPAIASAAPQHLMQKVAKYCDQILALSWKGYRHYGPGAVVFTEQPDGPEIAYIERKRLSDPDCLMAIANNRPEASAVVLYYDDGNYDRSDYEVFILTGPHSPPECYAMLYDD
ncbi:MAG TPA: helix-turn-helix transcriptional regulator [Crinalium sp.]|jgi:putative transcriptional regulator